MGTLKGSYLCSRWSDLVEFQSHTSSNVCHFYLQVCKGSDQKQPRKGGDVIFSIIKPFGSYLLPLTLVLIQSRSKRFAAFPNLNYASDTIYPNHVTLKCISRKCRPERFKINFAKLLNRTRILKPSKRKYAYLYFQSSKSDYAG